MKRIYSKIIICLLLTAMLLPFGSQGAGAAGAPIDGAIRVGLAYGSGTLPIANLENSVGSGYRFGYFDGGLNFIQLGYTAETKISMVATEDGGISVVKTGAEELLFQHDAAVAGDALAVKPGQDDTVKTTTWFAGRKYYGSFRYQRFGGGNLTVVNIVDMEDYINCVISQEMSEGWPLETLKAQAVAARSFVVSSSTKHLSYKFDVCATTDCQAYTGVERIGPTTTKATEETVGQYAWYDGKIAQTFYFSCDGGATENSENVWISAVPYLRGVVDPWEATVESEIIKQRKNYHYSVTYTKTELEQKLQAKNYDIKNLVGVTLTSTALGNVKSITFADASGKTQTIFGDSARIFIYPSGSVRFTMTSGSGGGGYYVNGSDSSISSVSGAYAVDGGGNMSQVGEGVYVITGAGTEQLQSPQPSDSGGDSYTFTGSGYGHNIGMSQWGAYAMGKAGKNYIEILQFYYTGIEVR